MFAEQFVNGLVLGAVYALIAVGFALQFSILRIINLAYGETMMASAFVGYLILTHTELGHLVAAMAAIGVGAATGLLLERYALRYVRGGDEMTPLMITIGIATLLTSAFSMLFGFEQRAFPRHYSGGFLSIGDIQITVVQVVIFAVAVVTMVSLQVVLARTSFGRAIRATAEREHIAAAFGVDVRMVKVISIGLSSGLGGLAGILIAENFGVISPFIGSTFGLKALVVLIIGGAASLAGAVAGGLFLGMIEVMASAYFLSEYRDAISYSILIVVLAIWPRGFVPRAVLR